MPLPAVATSTKPAPTVALQKVVRFVAEGDGRRPVLDGISARIEAGEIVALLGPSGAGKSTLLNLVAGIDLPDAGSIHVTGEALTALSERTRTLLRRYRIGFVFQAFNLVPTLTIAENVALTLELNDWAPAPTRERVAELLAAVGLAGMRQRFPGELSGGEQQRVAVARALAHRPALVLADEPTGNLDSAAGARVMELLLGLCRESGGACLLVTHSHSVAARADRRLRLADGQLHEDGA